MHRQSNLKTGQTCTRPDWKRNYMKVRTVLVIRFVVMAFFPSNTELSYLQSVEMHTIESMKQSRETVCKQMQVNELL